MNNILIRLKTTSGLLYLLKFSTFCKIGEINYYIKDNYSTTDNELNNRFCYEIYVWKSSADIAKFERDY